MDETKVQTPETCDKLCPICGKRPHHRSTYCSRLCADSAKKIRSREVGYVAARFWSRVDKRGPDECWPWRGALLNGYGNFAIGGRGCPVVNASRIALALHTGLYHDGAIGTELYCLHSCDNRACVNPSHLRWGTCLDNIRDMVERGRHARGATHHWVLHPETIPRGEARSRLRAEQVTAAREEYARGGVSQQTIAERLGIKRSSFEDIVHRRTWKHIP